MHFHFISVPLHLLNVKFLVFKIENTSREQVLNLFTAERTASLSFEPLEKAGPVEYMFEFVAVKTNDGALSLEIFEADGAGLWEMDCHLLVAGLDILL